MIGWVMVDRAAPVCGLFVVLIVMLWYCATVILPMYSCTQYGARERVDIGAAPTRESESVARAAT